MPNPNAMGFQLLVNGQMYGGWVSIEVTRSIDAMAPSFEVESTERWPGQPANWPVQTGDAVKVTVDGESLMTGWVDEVEPEEDGAQHTIRIRGRGKTGDLVDCSAMNRPGRWSNRKIEQIISELTAPFGISTTAIGDTGAPVKAFALQQGEAVKDAIDRLIQMRGVLPIESPDGNLQLITPATTGAIGVLTLGGAGANVTHASAKHDAKERFSTYVVKGNRQGRDGDHGKGANQVTALAVDPLVTRYRPLVIIAEEQADAGGTASRAKFAATVRAARSQTGKLTTPGARNAGGALWAPNALVTVNAPDMGLQGDLMINEVRYRDSEEGTLSEISVVRPEAYSLGEVKGVGLSRLDSRHAGLGVKARKGRR